MLRSGRAPIASLFGAAALAGCVFLPRTDSHYNAECRVNERKMTLESYQVATLYGCSNQSCGVLLATVGVVSAASVVVSGSVVVVGNVVYWLEKQGACLGITTGDQPPADVPP